MRRYATAIAIAVLIGLAWLAFDRESGQSPTNRCLPQAGASPSASATPAVVALLGDEIDDAGKFEGPHVHRLLRISLPDAEVQVERTLGRRLPNRAIDRDDSYRLNGARAPLLAATRTARPWSCLSGSPPQGGTALRSSTRPPSRPAARTCSRRTFATAA